MSDITPRPNRTPRRNREERAYKLVLAGGAAGVIAVVTFILAIVGVMAASASRYIAALVAVLCGWMFRRTVGGAAQARVRQPAEHVGRVLVRREHRVEGVLDRPSRATNASRL